MASMQIFVSHSHHDSSFCHDLVQALRHAGADVWYDEHNLESGQLMEVVQRELDRRPVFIVILSPSAFASRWVLRETGWAYELADRDPTRIILPVTAQAIERTAFSGQAGWLFLSDFKRVEAPSYRPYPQLEAIRRTLHALALTGQGEASLPVAVQPGESAETLIERGKALQTQNRYEEALPLFERASHIALRSFDAWSNMGYILSELKRNQESLVACNHALSLDPGVAWVWNNKGNALTRLKCFQEALDMYNCALSLNPNFAIAWYNKGLVLNYFQRPQEALDAYDRALSLDPTLVKAWREKVLTFLALRRIQEVLAAADHARQLEGS